MEVNYAEHVFRKQAVADNLEDEGVTLDQIIRGLHPEASDVFDKPKPIKDRQKSEKKENLKKRMIKNSFGRALEKKLTELPKNKVVDVSKITEEGKGTKTIVQPGSRSAKRQALNLPIVSDDLEKYVLALSLMPDGIFKYNNEIQEMERIFGKKSILFERLIGERLEDSSVKPLIIRQDMGGGIRKAPGGEMKAIKFENFPRAKGVIDDLNN